MKSILFVFCLCQSVLGYTMNTSTNPTQYCLNDTIVEVVIDGDSGVFFPRADFEKQEIKRINHKYSLNSAVRANGEVSILKKDKQDLTKALELKTEECEIGGRMSKAYETSYTSEKKAHEETTKDLKKARNGSRFWRFATGVVAAVGTTLYIVK